MTILAMREKTPFGRGRERTITRLIRTEDSNEAWEFAGKHVRKGSTIHADEHFSYDDLQGLQELKRVNHISVKYFDWYAAEIARREDNRRVDNGTQMWGMVHFALSRKTSRNLCGYWEGSKPPDLVWENGVSPDRA
jgi:hypothetical protein